MNFFHDVAWHHWQLGDVGGDPPRLFARQQVRRRAPSRLILAIDMGDRLPIAVADDEAGVGFLH